MLGTVIIRETDRDGKVTARIDLSEEYGLILTNDSVLNPPPVRINRVEIPARDGGLDLTEVLTGDAVLSDRELELVFYVREKDGVDNIQDFERVKTQMQNYLHGRELEFELSFDPGYIYKGRWECDSYYMRLHYREIKFTVTCEPWKRGEHKHYEQEFGGGKTITVVNARRHVSPTFTTHGPATVQYPATENLSNRVWEIPEAGEWTLDLHLMEGKSDIYINSAPDQCTTTVDQFIAYLNDCRLDELPVKRLSDFYFLDDKDRPHGEQYRVSIDYDLYDL